MPNANFSKLYCILILTIGMLIAVDLKLIMQSNYEIETNLIGH